MTKAKRTIILIASFIILTMIYAVAREVLPSAPLLRFLVLGTTGCIFLYIWSATKKRLPGSHKSSSNS